MEAPVCACASRREFRDSSTVIWVLLKRLLLIALGFGIYINTQAHVLLKLSGSFQFICLGKGQATPCLRTLFFLVLGNL